MRTAVLLAFGALSCASAGSSRAVAPAEYVRPADTKATVGRAPQAQRRLLVAHADGSREYALVLRAGDELASALLDFAKVEGVAAARLTGLGAVRDARVAWFDLEKKAYRVRTFSGPVELLALTGDVGVDDAGEIVIHAHAVLSDADGHASGGHLVSALAAPNVEIFVTTYPARLVKRPFPEFESKFFDLNR